MKEKIEITIKNLTNQLNDQAVKVTALEKNLEMEKATLNQMDGQIKGLQMVLNEFKREEAEAKEKEAKENDKAKPSKKEKDE